MTKPDAEIVANAKVNGGPQHSVFWFKRYWFWLGAGKKPGEAARLATQDEKGAKR
jgi:hypothetical protein